MLIECKECKKKISDQADLCPQCGVPNPSVPYELERLYDERDKLKREEKRQAEIYQNYNDLLDDFPLVLIRWSRNRSLKEKVDKHVFLANQAQQAYQEKNKEIFEYERRLREGRRLR